MRLCDRIQPTNLFLVYRTVARLLVAMHDKLTTFANGAHRDNRSRHSHSRTKGDNQARPRHLLCPRKANDGAMDATVASGGHRHAPVLRVRFSVPLIHGPTMATRLRASSAMHQRHQVPSKLQRRAVLQRDRSVHPRDYAGPSGKDLKFYRREIESGSEWLLYSSSL